MPKVRAPPGVLKERSVPWAPCQYPVDSAISCGNGAWFSLTAINNRLRHFPELAFGTKIHCVSDCASAEAFVIASSQYQNEHPDCCASEPLDVPIPPDPPPPPPT
jgi:hypothetical protein